MLDRVHVERDGAWEVPESEVGGLRRGSCTIGEGGQRGVGSESLAWRMIPGGLLLQEGDRRGTGSLEDDTGPPRVQGRRRGRREQQIYAGGSGWVMSGRGRGGVECGHDHGGGGQEKPAEDVESKNHNFGGWRVVVDNKISLPLSSSSSRDWRTDAGGLIILRATGGGSFSVDVPAKKYLLDGFLQVGKCASGTHKLFEREKDFRTKMTRCNDKHILHEHKTPADDVGKWNASTSPVEHDADKRFSNRQLPKQIAKNPE